MKRLIIAAAAWITFWTAAFSQAETVTPSANILTSFDFSIVGVGLKADPAYQAVPKGIASQVKTGFDAGTFNVADIIAQLPADYTVRAELSGPAFQTPVPLVTKPGKPFDLPSLPILGKYTLSNIRLVDGAGKTVFGAVPQAVAIESIPDPLITQVTTRPLSLQELQERGVTFDSSNFTAYEFTAGIATRSGQVPLTLPVIIPNKTSGINPEPVPPPTPIGLSPPSFDNVPPQPELPDNLFVTGFMMGGGDENGGAIGGLPSIPGVIVIPGNIGFLHQYFSALAIVTNGAPGQSDLIIKDVKVKIILPPGENLQPGTDAAPNDDPLRMAKGENGFFPREMPVLHPGPDGKYGTSDDISSLKPSESGQADFTIEGLKEGTHKLDFEITATLEGLPIGPVTLKGKATGAVLVRNPDFAITMGHPATVRSGEAYDLFITVTNTGKSVANLVSVHLDQRALSGVVFAAGEEPDKQIETILPGSAATVKFRLVSQRTGKVTATVFESPDMKGRFILRAGVGENNIPLSPDSLILPYVGDFPADLVSSAVGLLGQAWSVVTAPTGALPADVLPITKQTVTNRAYDLSEAGLRVLIGDTMLKAVEDLAFDFIGSNNANRGFDDLRRRSTQGLNLNNALAAIFEKDIQASDPFTFQAGLAEKVSYRPVHISVITSDAPVRVRISDGAGKKTGGLSQDEALRGIPYADQLFLSDSGSSRSTLTLATKLDSAGYLLELAAEAAANFDLGIVLPDANGVLQQVKFSGVSLPAGAKASMVLNPAGNGAYSLAIDENGDGIVDANLAASAVTAIADKGPQVVAATQIGPGFGPGGDIHGRNVAILFSKQVTKESAQNVGNFSVEGNAVKASVLQTSGRMAFIFLRDGIGPFYERSITVSGLGDAKGNLMAAPVTLPIKATAGGPAAVVAGVVRTARGEAIPGAVVQLVQGHSVVGEKISAADGSFQFDYVMKNQFEYPFEIAATNPATGELGHLFGNVLFHGQRLNVDIFMKARGSVSGTVRDAAGTPMANAAVQITTLNDGRTYLTYTDASGVFSFAGISVGPFNLKSVSQTAYAEGTVMGTLPDDGSNVIQDITIYRLADVKKGNVTGRVLGPDGVTPRPGVVVIVESPRYKNWVRSGADGSYAFSGVFAGAATVNAQDLTSGERSMATGTVSEGVTSVYNLILKGTGTVVGQVQRGDGKSAAGLYVVANVNSITRIVQADEAGGFRFDGLPVGEVHINVKDPKDANRDVISGTVSLFTAGETANIFLYIPAEALNLGTIQGTAYRLGGSAAPFAEVRLVDFGSNAYRPYKADSTGKYLIEDLPIGVYYLVMINGREIANATVNLWHSGQVSTTDLHPVGVGTITGTIYDEGSGMMPVGADVTLISNKPDKYGWLIYDPKNSTTVKSDPQTGRYNFSGVYMGNFSISASNIFRPVSTVSSGVLKDNGQPLTVDLTLKDTFGSISGRVLQPDGAPVGEGVRLTVNFGGADVTVTTDAAGKFAFRPILPAGNYTLTAEDPITTLKWRGIVSVVAALDVPVDIRLLGRGSVTVLVSNADGTPAAGAKVDVVGVNYPNDSASGVSGQNGSITFDNLSEGSYAVSAMGGFNLGGRNQGKIPADRANVTVSVILAPSGKVVGKFFKADGVTPISGGEIKLLKYGQVYAYTATSSDSATLGEFSFDFVPLGDFSLEGFDPVSLRRGIGGGRLTTNGETVTGNLVVIPRGTVKGVVLNNSGTAPIDKAGVTIVVSGSVSISYSTVTAPDGSYIFTGVPAGRFTVDATDPSNGLRGQASGTISYEGETAQAVVHIAPTGFIKGRVLMPDGIALALNATVSLQYENPRTTVDPQTGEFMFSNLASGRSYTLVATEANTHRGGKAIATISGDGAVAVADVILRGVGAVQGTIFDTDGVTPLAGATVRLQSNDITSVTSASYTDYTGPDGSFKFVDVPAGSFTLQTTHPQRITAAASSGYLKDEGEVVTVNMTIGPVASVTGKVLLADGMTPARGGGVRFSGNGRTFIAVIDTDGVFSLQNIPVPCTFSLSMEDAAGLGIGKYNGSLTTNGEVLDIGAIVLDDKPITVTEVSPADGSVNVPTGQAVKVLFSEPADPATVTAANIYLAQGSSRIAAALTLDPDNRGVTLTPSAPLTGFTSYTVVVTTGVKDRVGRALPQNFTASFTTIDNIPPAVVSISPANGSIEIAADGVVRVAFNETIHPASTSGIRLLQGGTPVDTRLDLVQGGTVAVLTPLAPLAYNAVYTVSVSGVQDVVGNAMPGSVLATFNTIDTIAPTITSLSVPATADLIRGNTVTVTAVSPDTDVAFVDFYVDDKLTATDTTAPYTMNLLLAQEGVIRVKAVAQDRAGNRWLPVSLDLDVKADMPPTVAITAPADGSTVNTGSSVTVTAQAQDDLAVREIALSATGEAIFSQTKTSSGGKSFTSSFTFNVPTAISQGGTILLSAVAKDSAGNSSQVVQRTLTVRDSMAPVAASLVSPGQTVKYRPGDTGTATFVATDNTGVANIACSATGAATASQTFALAPPQTSASQVFSFSVAANAAPYATTTITCTAFDAAGNQAAKSITLTVADVIPPQVTGASIANNATDVPVGSSISVSFSEPLAASTVTGANVVLTDAAVQPVPGGITLAADRKGVTFKPTTLLARGVAYTLTVSTAVTDDAGNPLATPYVVAFTTDSTAPSLKAISPASGSQNVPVGTAVAFTFSEAIDPASVSSGSIVLTSAFGQVAGTMSLSTDNLSVIFKPLGQLSFSRDYTVTFKASVADISGNVTAVDYTGTFLTQSTSSDLVSLWTMDGDWSDSSGNGNHGTANGGAAFSSDHVGGTMAGSFDGVNDYIKVNNSSTLNPANITVEAWVKSATPLWNSAGSIVSKYYACTLRPVQGTKEIRFYVWPGGSQQYVSINDPDLDLTQWHHYAATADGYVIKLYIDGVLRNSVVYYGNLYTAGTNSLNIGWDDWQSGGYFKGLIDEVAIYKQALPAEDILEHYHAGQTSDRLPPAPPTVNAVDSPTYGNNIILSGTKEADASIRVNGRQVVGHDASTTWQALYSLQPGQNILDITSRDLAGNASEPVTISVDLLPANQREPDIVGLWHLDENWLDYSGNGNHGTPNNGATFTAERIEGMAAGSLDGVNDYGSIADSASLDVTTAMTLEAWIKPGDVSTYRQIVSKFGAYGNYAYQIGLAPTGQIRYDISGNGSVSDSLVSTNAPITQNKWHHVAATFNAGALKLYVNGAEVASKTSSINALKAGTTPLNLGRDPAGGAQYFNGLIDEVAIYKRALTPEEIQSHKNASPIVSLASLGQTVKYRPGAAGTATVTVNHNPGVSSLTCTASGAASGMVILPFGSPQTTVTQDFSFQVATNAPSYATVTLTCSAVSATGHIGSSSINLTVADIVAPTVAGASIADNATNVAATKTFAVTFNEALAQSSVNTSSVTLMTDNGTNQPVAGMVTLSPDLKSISFSPAMALEGNTAYRLTVSTAVTDTAGNPLVSDYILHFTTQPVTAVSVTGKGTSSVPYVVAAGRYSTISITGSYVVFDGPVAADSLSLTSGSVLTHLQTGLTGAERLEIYAANITIDVTSKIDVSGKGYLGSWQGGNGGLPRTYGNTTSGASSDYYNGGSYGGLGGIGSSGSVNAAYGDLTNPNEVGSGGSGHSGSSGYPGGNGGGLVRIKAGTLSLNGSIVADGGSVYYGGGSGGGIRIDVSMLTGSGGIYARGGNSTYYGTGGGGRIAVYYDTNGLPLSNIIASGGKNTYYNTATRNGGAGTIYLKESAKTKGDLVIGNGGVVTTTATEVSGGDYGFVDIKSGTNVSMSGNVSFGSDTVITGSQVTVSGGIIISGNLTLDNGSLSVGDTANIGGTLDLRNNGILSHLGSTTTVQRKLDVIASSITIDATSKIDVSGKGYLGAWQGGNGGLPRTYGNTTSGASSDYYNGGSYGGLGGIYSSGSVNAAYGDLTNPNEPGSGGSGHSGSSSYPGGNGGGLVRIKAGTLSLNGSIVADGGSVYYGGGSGGGIRIDVSTLTGSGGIYARGGNSTYYGAGGGGRIAVYYDTNGLPLSNIIASGGKNTYNNTATRNGGAGTIYLKDSAKANGDLIVDNWGIVTTNTTMVPDGTYGSVNVKGGAVMEINNSQLSISGGIVMSGNLTLDQSSVTVGDAVSIGGALTLQNQSLLTHYGTSTTTQAKLDITASSITIDATSKIDASGKGYLGAWQGGNGGLPRTYGNTTSGASSDSYNGGSYGGLGGIYNSGSVNAAYGDLTNPDEPGSGGSGYSASSGYPGGNGGGLVRIKAGTLSLNGSIVADGGSVTNATYYGGGSGGGIRIDVSTLTGSGGIYARGGNSTYYGAGGGGRIAVYYDTNGLPVANIIASGGKNTYNNTATRNGGAGTIYLKDSTRVNGDLIVDNRGIDCRENSTELKSLGRGVTSIITYNSLTRTGANWTPGTFAGFKVNPDVNQKQYFTVADNNADTIFIDPAGGNLNSVAAVGDMYSGVFVFNSLHILGKGRVYCNEQFNIDTDLLIDDSTLVTNEAFADKVTLHNGGVLSHPSTTTTTAYRLTLGIGTDLTVDATSRIDVSGKGYPGAWQGGNNGNAGMTLGNTTAGGSTVYNGGSYGGLGGISYLGGGVNVGYGSLQVPNGLGSGGGGNGISSPGGNGGGFAKITAGALYLAGSITADGGATTASSGGSGGGILINVDTLSGSGTICARGGASTYSYPYYGAGGGGRIAIYYTASTLPTANIIASGGKSGDGSIAARNGGAGTIYFQQQ